MTELLCSKHNWSKQSNRLISIKTSQNPGDITGAPNGNFRENICSEDHLRTRIFGTFVVKFSCLPASPRIFEHLQNGIITHFKRIFTLKKAT